MTCYVSSGTLNLTKLKLPVHIISTHVDTDNLPLQMAERLLRAQPLSVANHVKARQSLIEHALTWLDTESGWARSEHSAICSGKLCRGFIILSSAAPVDTSDTLDDVISVIKQDSK